MQEVDGSLLLMSVRSPDDWRLLEDAGRLNGGTRVVAILPTASLEAYQRAFSAGACAVAEQEAAVEEILQVVEAALEKKALLPVKIVVDLADGVTSIPQQVDLSEAEIDCLRALAEGATVAQLARRANYSQREMYRLLRRLYERMGARNRTEAVVLAARWGLLR